MNKKTAVIIIAIIIIAGLVLAGIFGFGLLDDAKADDKTETENETTEAETALETTVENTRPVLTFTHQLVDNNSYRPHCKAVGDINGDGYIDLLIGNNKGVFWYEYPDWEKHKINSGLTTVGMDASDIDGDGDVDLVAPLNGNGGPVYWYENPLINGDGDPAVIWEKHLLATGIGAHDVNIGDMNNDGKADIVIRDLYNTSTTRVLIQGDTPLNWTNIIASKIKGEGTDLGDIDNDGDLDILIDGAWLENPLPSGNIDSEWPRHKIASGWANQLGVVIADINNDGRPDAVFSPSESMGRCAWYEAPADPKTGEWKEHLINPQAQNNHIIRAADMDMDGDVDVITAEMEQSPNPDNVSIWLNEDGFGMQWQEQVIDTKGSHSIRVVDIDSDGDLDIFGANHGNKGAAPQIDIWRNDTPHQLSIDKWERHVIGVNMCTALFIKASDVNLDGKKDIVAGNWWYENPGNIRDEWQRNTISSGEIFLQASEVFDFDNNGTPDIFGYTTRTNNYKGTTHKFAWASNDGRGNFTVHDNIQKANKGDFLMGAVARRYSYGSPIEIAIKWHDNSSPGVQMIKVPENPYEETWDWRRISSTNDGHELAAADIDGDGDIDIDTGDLWLRNIGGSPTRWEDVSKSNASGWVHKVTLVDINRDGQLDAVTGYENWQGGTEKFMWYEGPADPSEQWTGQMIADDIIGPMNVDAADIDKDGDVDFILGMHNPKNPKSCRTYIFENIDGNGESFERHELKEANGDEHHDGCKFSDIDGDGDLDIISIGWTHKNVIVYENLAIVR